MPSIELSKSRSYPQKGFTLIELIVTIAIIAILAAIILPAFAKARDRADNASCESNLRQLSLGVIMYSDDFDDRCPLYFAGYNVTPGSRNPGATGPTHAPFQYWPELISPYVQKQVSHDLNTASKIFICPDAPYNSALISAHGISNITSYGLTDNWADWYCPDDCINGTGQSHSFTEASAPSNTVLLAETINNTDVNYPGASLAMTPIDGGNSGASYKVCDSEGSPTFSTEREFLNLSWRHTQRKAAWCDTPPSGARINVAYSDGHAGSKTLAQLADFSQWAVKQGHGDVGCHMNIDGKSACWFP